MKEIDRSIKQTMLENILLYISVTLSFALVAFAFFTPNEFFHGDSSIIFVAAGIAVVIMATIWLGLSLRDRNKVFSHSKT